MDKKELVMLSWENLWRMKFRTILTVIGVVIGTAAIVIMISIGNGAQESITGQLTNSPSVTTLTVLSPGQMESMVGMSSGREKKKITDTTISEISQIEHVSAVTPVISGGGGEFTHKRENYSVSMVGIDYKYIENMRYQLEGGRLPHKSEDNAVLLGSSIFSKFEIGENGMGTIVKGDINPKDLIGKNITMTVQRTAEEGSNQPATSTTSQTTDQTTNKPPETPDTNVSEQSPAEEEVLVITPTEGDALNPITQDSDVRTPTTDNETSATEETTQPPQNIKTPQPPQVGDNKQPPKSGNGAGEEPKMESLPVKARVVGVISPTGDQEDSAVVMSMSKAEEIFNWQMRKEVTGAKKEYETLKVIVDDTENVEIVSQRIKEMGFQVLSLKAMLNSLNSVFKILQLILGGIGGVALLVASIGIVNTMTMSIYERTREIGIMKVIGASVSDIKQMFIVESTIIGCIGGLAGILFSYLTSGLINVIGGMAMGGGQASVAKISIITPGLALFALVFSTIVGMLAGFRPAAKAANLSALDAIKTE